jgi:hypothetical protein
LFSSRALFDASVQLTLSPSAIRNVENDGIQEDFAFLVGDERYSCPRVIARLSSRAILVQHSIDTSISEYQVETSDTKSQSGLFLSLTHGARFESTVNSRPLLFSLSRELKNSTIFGSLLEIELSSEGQICSLSDDDSIPFLAFQFYPLDDTELGQIPPSSLYHILSHPSLKLSTEDSLYSFLSTRLSVDSESFNLFQLLHFEYLFP